MTTDADLRDQAVAALATELEHLKQTTVGLKGKNPPPAPHWAAALAARQNALTLLAQIGAAPAPPATTHSGSGTIRDGSSYDPTHQADYASLDLLVVDLNAIGAASKTTPARRLFYRSACSVNTGYDSSIPSAMAQANGWLLKDSTGKLLINAGYPENNIGDISNPAFSAALAQNSIAYCKANGFTGIWCDDVVAFCTELCSALPATMTQPQWRAAMVAHVGLLGKALRAAGLEFVLNASGYIPGDPNSDNGTNEALFYTDLAKTGGPTGLTCEYYMQLSNGDPGVRTSAASWQGNWAGWRALHPLCRSLGVDFVPISYAEPNDPDCLYFKASFLLDYDGGTSCLLLSPTGAQVSGSPWSEDLGAPDGPAVESPAGVWTRTFSSKAHTIRVDSNAGTASIS